MGLKISESWKNLLAAVLSAYFFVFELRRVFFSPPVALHSALDFYINAVRGILIFVALPAFYLFKILDYFELVDFFPTFMSGVNPEYQSEGNEMVQVDIFYHAINFILIILVVIEVFTRIFS